MPEGSRFYKDLAHVSAEVGRIGCLQLLVIQRDSPAGVYPDRHSDDADHECGHEADMRTEPPSGITTDRRSYQYQELAHLTIRAKSCGSPTDDPERW